MQRSGRSSMSPDEIAAVFIDCGYREVPNAWASRNRIARNDKRKARCFQSPTTGRFLYLKVPPEDHATPMVWPIVISPDDCDVARSSASTKIQFRSEFTFGSMFARFSKSRKGGTRDEHFGLPLTTDDPTALREFLTAFDRSSRAA